jgi:GNAT superfamily N-acetyltransferase
MSAAILVRPIQPSDYGNWRPLWDAYNQFYGRHGPTALAEDITLATWQRFLSPGEPMHALVATLDDQVVGIAHYLFHRSTTRINDVCYLNDLFTRESLRGRGIGRQLIQSVYAAARAAGSQRVYWQTHHTNAAGRRLYDQVAAHEGFIVYSQTVA